MNIEINTEWIILFTLLFMDIAVVVALLINRLIRYNEFKKLEKQGKNRLYLEDISVLSAKNFLDTFVHRKQSVILNSTFKYDKNEIKMEKKYLRKLKSGFKVNRVEAAVKLGQIATDEARIALEKAITIERNIQVKLYLANALSDIKDERSLPFLVASLEKSNGWYRNRVNMLICDYEEELHNYLPKIIDREEIEIRELIVDFAGSYISGELKKYITNIIDTKLEIDINKLSPEEKIDCERLVCKSAEILAKVYPKVLVQDKYLYCSNLVIKNNAIHALACCSSRKNLEIVLGFLRDNDTARAAVASIGKMIDTQPEDISIIVDAYSNEKDIHVKTYYAEILSSKIEYFIMQLSSKDKATAADIIKQVLLSGKTSDIINFININKDVDIENEVVLIINSAVKIDRSLGDQFCLYLAPRLLEKLHIEKCEAKFDTKNNKIDKLMKKYALTVLVFAILIFPIIYIWSNYPVLSLMPFADHVRAYVIAFNYYLSYYLIAISMIYIILLIFSAFFVKRQSKLWSLKTKRMLFKKKILPSISIIVPAYNEEKVIVESINSLLNLVYPDYELIVVNDGSTDDTLRVLINTFDLKRVDSEIEEKIKTRPVIGVFKNYSMPKITLIDKQNGGKADSLNVGINASQKELFCGIDADSILEKEALLRLVAIDLDSNVETTALGGNIYPANGCKINRGEIMETCIPKNKLAKLQTVEYIRAFMAGRLGWAYVNSLLIVSGAFGLFRKGRVISAGGYLTSSGKYEKDTVGEDMELIVRIRKVMREKKLKFKIGYAFNANCWTEVPEDLQSLKKQRYRWQRGLIEILAIHKKMVFNPAYGRTGMIAMPYYFLFEMLGSLIETQGYIMVLLALFMGLLNTEILLLLLISSVLLGIFVSIASLLIAEKSENRFKIKDLFTLIFYAIIENFGPRQLLSIWRAIGFIKILNKKNTWGRMERKGFSEKSAVASA